MNAKDFNLDKYSNDSSIAYFDYPYEVDLDHTHGLHDLHNYYLLASEKKVREEVFSEYQLQMIGDNDFTLGKILFLIQVIKENTTSIIKTLFKLGVTIK